MSNPFRPARKSNICAYGNIEEKPICNRRLRFDLSPRRVNRMTRKNKKPSCCRLSVVRLELARILQEVFYFERRKHGRFVQWRDTKMSKRGCRISRKGTCPHKRGWRQFQGIAKFCVAPAGALDHHLLVVEAFSPWGMGGRSFSDITLSLPLSLARYKA